MYLNIQLEPEKTKELENYVKEVLPTLINEELFKDQNKLNAMIRECVKVQIKGCIAELLQGKNFREFLRDKIMTHIGMVEETTSCAD